MEFWDAFNANLPLVTAIGIWAGVLIALITLGFGIWRAAYVRSYDLPVVEARAYQQADGLPYRISFRLKDPKWMVAGARVRWRRKRVVHAGVSDNPSGQRENWRPLGPWRRSIRFNPPASKGHVLLHLDHSVRYRRVTVLLIVCLTSNTKVRRCIPIDRILDS